MMNYKKLKGLFNRLEKKEKELATYKAKVAKIEKEIEQIKEEIQKLLKVDEENLSY